MREREIFLTASEIEDPDQLVKFLDKACEGDDGLRQRLNVLLAASSGMGNFLEIPAVDQQWQASPATTLDQFPVTLDTGPSEPVAGSTMVDMKYADQQIENRLQFLEPPQQPGTLGRLGSYDILRVVGTGAFGIVLEARDDALHRVVAIKVLAPELALNSPARKRFLREARAAAAVRHEHVVHTYAVYEQPIPHLVMELIPGQTIQQHVDQFGPFAIADLVNIGRQIASGLTAAHATGLIHRDIKPSNILLENGKVKITDFGLARAVDDASVTQSGLIAGTPLYMSPEQATGALIDYRTDLFSLGSVLYFMASGQPPFEASTTFGVLKRVAEDTPRPMSEIVSNVPDWLCAIVSRLHEKRPEDRSVSASELARMLNQCSFDLERGQVPAIPVSPIANKSTQSVLRRPVVWVASLFITAFVAMSTVWLFSARKSPTEFSPPQTSPEQMTFDRNGLIELGPLITRSCVDDGHYEDLSFEDHVLKLDATGRSRNLWINFENIEANEISISTRIHVDNPDPQGMAKLIFKGYGGNETSGAVERNHGQLTATIKDWKDFQLVRETIVEIPTVDLHEWTDVRFVITRDQYLFYLDDVQITQMPRLSREKRFVSVCCRGWKCDMKSLQVIAEPPPEIVKSP